jgi:hypothetical protein
MIALPRGAIVKAEIEFNRGLILADGWPNPLGSRSLSGAQRAEALRRVL